MITEEMVNVAVDAAMTLSPSLYTDPDTMRYALEAVAPLLIAQGYEKAQQTCGDGCWLRIIHPSCPQEPDPQ